MSTGISRLLCGYKWANLRYVSKSNKKRPPKAIKDDVVRMRVTAEQKRAMEDAASREGLELSAWLRQLALRAAGALPSK